MADLIILKVNQKSFNKKNLKSVGMTLAKVKEQDGMTLAKVKEQDGDDSCKVRHAQVSHAPYWSAKYPTSAACQMRAPASFENWAGFTTLHMGRALES